MMIIRIAVRAPLVLIFAFTMAFIMGGSVAMVYLVIIPLLGFGLFFIIFKVRPIFSRVFHKYDALNESVEENVTGMRVVKATCAKTLRRRSSRPPRATSDGLHRAEKLLAFNNPMMNICVNGAFVVIIYLGSKLIITSQGTLFDVGQLSSIFTYGFQVLMSLMQLSMIFVMVTMADESAHRITGVLAAEPTIADPAEPVLEVADGSIDFDHVSFKYSAHAKRQALDDIDLHITSGETIGIIGGTGSAKSTLVNLIARLYDATEGTVCVGGVDVRDYDLDALRHQVAMVLQKNVLFSGTIAENLRWGDPNATDEEVREAAHLACADEFVDGFPKGYDTWIEQGGSNVSGGQKQRLCIARALLRRPKILILTTPPAPSTPRPTPRSAQGWQAICPTRPSSSSPSALAPCRTQTASSSWRAAASRRSATMTSCSKRARSTARPLPRKTRCLPRAKGPSRPTPRHPQRKLRPRKEARHMSKATTAERALNRKGGTMSRLIKTLFGFYPVLLPLVVVGVVLCAIINSIGATFLQSALQIISESWQSGDWEAAQPKILKLVTTLACIYGIGILSSLFWNRAMAVITQGSLEKLREKMFNRMQDLPIRYFDTHQRGDIMSHYTNDIDTLRQMISQSLPNLFQTCVVLVTVFVIMLYYSVWMCLVIVAGVAFMTFMTKLLGSNSARFLHCTADRTRRGRGPYRGSHERPEGRQGILPRVRRRGRF